jgi:hypothetical protein
MFDSKSHQSIAELTEKVTMKLNDDNTCLSVDEIRLKNAILLHAIYASDESRMRLSNAFSLQD